MESTSSQTAPLELSDREGRFVNAIIERCTKDKGLAARLRRADNPATEYQSWELLAAFGINLERDWERLPFVTVAAAIAKSKATHDGHHSLGQALAGCYDDGRESSQAKARLRRLLACSELAELVRHLRPTLSLVQSKCACDLNYCRLLKQLRFFSRDPQRVKAQWAQEFYGQPVSGSAEEVQS